MRDQAHVPAGSPTAQCRRLQSPSSLMRRVTWVLSPDTPCRLPGFPFVPAEPPPRPPAFSAVSELPGWAEAHDPHTC